jgi:hypothetical protein
MFDFDPSVLGKLAPQPVAVPEPVLAAEPKPALMAELESALLPGLEAELESELAMESSGAGAAARRRGFRFRSSSVPLST